MKIKEALDILIALAICSTKNNGLTCEDCPLDTGEDKCMWTDEKVAEAIKLIKTVKVLEPKPADPEVIIPIKALTKEQLKNILESLNIDVELFEDEKDGEQDG